MEIIVTYRLASDNSTILGVEKSSGIAEVLFPDVHYFGHTMTITKMFAGYTEHRWKVVSTTHPSNSEILIDLELRRTNDPETYLSQTYKQRNAVISNLQKGTIVEVDYGYIHSIKKQSGDIKSCKRYPDSKQSGEMHKRRLGIVIKASPSGVQVVPITSRTPSNVGDKSIFQVSFDSIQRLVHYNDTTKSAFALCGMIETISLNRIFPPLAHPLVSKSRKGPERSTGYPNKLTKSDKKLLDDALSSSIGLLDYTDLKKNYPMVYSENEANKAEIALLSASLQVERSKTSNYEALMTLVEDHYKQLYSSKSLQEIRQMIESELLDTRQILEGA
jgi:hypothetical protein